MHITIIVAYNRKCILNQNLFTSNISLTQNHIKTRPQKPINNEGCHP